VLRLDLLPARSSLDSALSSSRGDGLERISAFDQARAVQAQNWLFGSSVPRCRVRGPEKAVSSNQIDLEMPARFAGRRFCTMCS